MTPQEKADFRALIMPHNPCKEALERYDAAEGDEVYHIIMNYALWLFNNGIEIPKLPDHITKLKYDAYLRGYPHPLPQLTSIGWSAGLRGYAHPLPQLTSIGLDAYLGGYQHPLPQLTSIGLDADLWGYKYANELKQNCKIKGRIYE